ncbi:hypothetical protein [Glaciibacter sp. 2TAF33]|uniref:hypothetical protein n=1 Tax=Glaciibacter sp. 2TAF33 TaxID=3233015 RepID=UPI003F8E6621
MSTIKHPVGPQSSKVYWRRRLVVGLGLLAVLVIIFLIVVKPGSSSGQPTNARPAATDAASDAPKDTAAATIPDKTTAVDGAPCDPKNVNVEAITDAVDYDPGQKPQFSLSLTNTGTKSCVINAGTSQQVFTVTSGSDAYWTSTDCQSEPVDAQVTLEPGTPISSSTPISWDRTRSAPDTCDAPSREAAPAGGASYHLAVTVAGIKSASPKQFLLY